MDPNINTLFQFAASCNYKNHDALAISSDQLVCVPKSAAQDSQISAIISKAIEAHQQCPEDQKPISRASLEIIRDHLENESNSTIRKLQNIFFGNKPDLKPEIEKLNAALRSKPLPASSKNQEQVFLLKFLANLPKHLNVSNAPSSENFITFHWKDGQSDKRNVNEWKIIKTLSETIYQSSQVQDLPSDERFSKYQELMRHIYTGSHFLIEDDEKNPLETQLNPEETPQAIIRASSHYEKGRPIVDWNEKGEPIYAGDEHKDLLQAETKHFGLSGKHIRHILFNTLEAHETTSGKIIPAKTARQISKLKEANALQEKEELKATPKRFVALQSESSPDCEGNDWLGPIQGRGFLFYTHRLAGFVTYRFLKMVGVENANVGAYGFGRTDLNPIILTKAKTVS